MELNGSAVVVTGAASGLGRAVAEAMLARGARVLALDLALPTLAAPDGMVLARAVDVCDETTLRAALGEGRQVLGEFRACVNCAGILDAGRTLGRNGPLALERFRRVIEVNLVGTFNVVRLVAESMAGNLPLGDDGERGAIVNTGSIAGFEGQTGQAAYAASKAGVIGLTLPLARDLAPLGIRVNAICPGAFDTRMMAGASDELMEGLRNSVAFPHRIGRPAEFAALAVHLCENGYMNGEVIRLDGGARLPMS